MKTISVALAAHLAGQVTTLAHLIKIVRRDAVVYAVTDHDKDIVYDGATYLAKLGLDRSAIKSTSTLSVDNLDARGFLTALGITEASIASGVWDYFDVRIFRVNWADLSMLDEKLFRGWAGEVSLGNGEVKVEFRSLAQKLQSRIGEIVTPNCKADLFDSRCKLVATEGVWKFSAVAVSTIVSAQRQFTAAALTQAVDFFTSGRVVWTSGPNIGLDKEIKAHAASGNILLQEPMPYAFGVGDTFTIYAGCSKRYDEDCLAKFANTDNFRGFPFLPGTDAMLRGPQ